MTSHAQLEKWLQQLSAGQEPDDMYHIVREWGRAQYLTARPLVESFLQHHLPYIRSIALHALTYEWGLQEHWASAVEMLTSDIDDECRRRGAFGLGILMRNTQDSTTLAILARTVANRFEHPYVRESAYMHLLSVAGLGDVLRETSSKKTEIDWELVQLYDQG